MMAGVTLDPEEKFCHPLMYTLLPAEKTVYVRRGGVENTLKHLVTG